MLVSIKGFIVTYTDVFTMNATVKTKVHFDNVLDKYKQMICCKAKMFCHAYEEIHGWIKVSLNDYVHLAKKAVQRKFDKRSIALEDRVESLKYMESCCTKTLNFWRTQPNSFVKKLTTEYFEEVFLESTTMVSNLKVMIETERAIDQKKKWTSLIVGAFLVEAVYLCCQ
ncbi:unnamed protein product [Bursaphelenchus okinawaensis]|uniref:Uncharacterized protein n=1 Tax=Bursaphelenchus okinawaensis TaxID=465554 RepID=A0A811KA18_9BILA|nr:unnamed protein product [Bursaphelenchus okinawaensis]CAG9098818.1 unnamed protein product [Bursaphelenchus okinawaensis]